VPRFDLAATLRDLATRNPGRSEADIQAMVRDVLLYGGFDLGDEAVALESPAEDRRRLDVSVGAVIIECKRDLRARATLGRAEAQLGEYLAAKAAAGGHYAGVLTDGAMWRLYRHADLGPVCLDVLLVNPARVDDRRFRWWLGAILATERQVTPTLAAIEERFGAGAPSFRLLRAALLDCWHSAEDDPTVALKRQLWAKLLHSALGSQFDDTDELFVEHTYMVLLATLIGHAVIGFDLNSARHEPGVLLSGQLFERAGLLGVGQAGFFDWVLDSAGGGDVVSDIARRVALFRWVDVDHDVLKALYQSVIAPEVRKRLGEYYTPDWLARRMVDEVVDDALHQRILDPACGSGTFLFHAVRRHLDAATAVGVPVSDALEKVTTSVFGVDLHPVAVALAQTTYLLAIGPERLAQRTRTLNIPVYLGDSMRWEAAEESIFAAGGDVVLYTTDGAQLFADELRFPASVVADVGRFDYLVNELATRASTRLQGGRRQGIRGLLNNLGIPEAARSTVEATYSVLCDLYDQGRNHIWGFYIRNQSRPTWLSRPENRVDVLVGNPPWLAYRFMPEALQRVFERRARERNLWMGGARGRTTQHDLSAFFVARAIELYLRVGGRFGFVMPRAVLSRQTYGGFRAGDYSSSSETCFAAFATSWDLGKVQPQPFPVPSGVVFGTRSTKSKSLSSKVRAWSGRAPTRGVDSDTLASVDATVAAVTGEESISPYVHLSLQGALQAGGDPGPSNADHGGRCAKRSPRVPQGRRAVRSRKSSLDKPPWKHLPAHEGVVESIFVRPAYLGESVAPFRLLRTLEAVIPYDGTRLMDGADDRIDRYSGLAAWWREAEQIWLQHRSSDKRTLIEQLDYMRQLSAQLPIARWRVAYSASGNTLAAVVIQDHLGVIEHSLYWAPAATREEAQYLVAILNAPSLNTLVQPYQSVGLFGPRHFDKYVWQSPIPVFDPGNPLHQHLVELAMDAESVAGRVELQGRESFQAARRLIRQELAVMDIALALDEAVEQLLDPGRAPTARAAEPPASARATRVTRPARP
jgi:SAM-dependent methyltransferase